MAVERWVGGEHRDVEFRDFSYPPGALEFRAMLYPPGSLGTLKIMKVNMIEMIK